MKVVFVYSLFLVSVGMGLLISVPEPSLSAEELWKSPTAGFFKSKFL
jgi:hypothetical protein